MQPVVDSNLPAIRELCRRHRVRSLDLFGSATGSGFDPGRSDFDFLVDFGRTDLGPWMADYFRLKEELESLLGRPVDLVLATAPRTPYFAASLDASRVPVYAAA